MELAVAAATAASLHCSGRSSMEFTDLETAMRAAKSHYPLDYMIAIGGVKSGSSLFVCDETTFRSILNLQGFGTHRRDTLIIWLPFD